MLGPYLALYRPVLHDLVQPLLSLLAVLFSPALCGSTSWVFIISCAKKFFVSFLSYNSISYLFHQAPLAVVSQDLVKNNSTSNLAITSLILQAIFSPQPSILQSELSDFLDILKSRWSMHLIILVTFRCTYSNSTIAFLKQWDQNQQALFCLLLLLLYMVLFNTKCVIQQLPQGK